MAAPRPVPDGAGRLGMIGLGNMGEPMALRLANAGHRPVVFDIDPAPLRRLAAAGAEAVRSAADVGRLADTVLVCLPRPAAVEAVAFGPVGLGRGGRFSAYVDLSTTGPAVMEKVARAFARSGVASLDSPVSGGVAGARDGTLAIMAAGPRALFRRLRPVLEILGASLFHVGERPGQAQVMKLVNNLLSVTAWTVTAEGLAIGAKAGLDPGLMLDVLQAGSGRNIATEDRFRRYVLTRGFDSGFTMDGICKDIGLCLEQARAQGVPAPVGQAVERLWLEASRRGWGERGHAHIASLYEEWAGVEFAATRAAD